MGTWERWNSNKGAGCQCVSVSIFFVFFYWGSWAVQSLVILPEKRVIPQHFGQFLIKRCVEISQNLFSDGQHRS